MKLLKGTRKKIRNTRINIDRFEPNASDSRKMKLYKDVLESCVKYGIEPHEYFRFGFNMLSDEGRRSIVTNASRFEYYKVFNDESYSEILDQKEKTYELIGEFYKRDVMFLESKDDVEKLTEWIQKHPSFIFKPTAAWSGHGVRIVKAEDYASVEEMCENLLEGGSGLCEELIIQGEQFAKFHPESVNTVRIAAYLDENRELKIQWCFFRIGVGDSVIDNVSGGGLAAIIDPETGVVIESAKDYRRHKFIYHPDTGEQIVGFKMPEWDECKKMVTEIACRIPQLRFVGWDMAYTNKGWVFVEGNSHPMCTAIQITEFNGCKDMYEDMKRRFQAENK